MTIDRMDPTPEDYRRTLERLESVINSLGRAAAALYDTNDNHYCEIINTTVFSVEVICDELKAEIAGVFCVLCGHRAHGSCALGYEDCQDAAPNPQFRCHCQGPCPHGREQWCCKECRADKWEPCYGQ